MRYNWGSSCQSPFFKIRGRLPVPVWESQPMRRTRISPKLCNYLRRRTPGLRLKALSNVIISPTPDSKEISAIR